MAGTHGGPDSLPPLDVRPLSLYIGRTRTKGGLMRVPFALSVVAGLGLLAGVAQAGEAKDTGTAGDPYKVLDGFKFTEGPAPARDGSVYFTDIPNNKILKVDPKGELTTFLEDSKAANGLMVDGGRLLAAQKDEGRVISIDLATRAVSIVADKFEGNRFIGPNDLVVDKQGGVYFTDPRFP